MERANGDGVVHKSIQTWPLTPPRSSQPTPRSTTDWISNITQAWARGSANTLELAQLVSEAKESLRYGEWSQLWRCNCLPFSKRKGEMLALVGVTLGKLDAQNSAHLPSAWNTLYHLARLGRTTVEQFVREERIHSRLTLKGAKALVAEHRPEAPHKNSGPAVKQRLKRFAAFVQATVGNWSDSERRLAQTELLRLLEEICPCPPNRALHQSPQEITSLTIK